MRRAALVCSCGDREIDRYFRGSQVMWLRRNADWASLLTLDNTTHISDSRYSVRFQYPNNWRLAISGVRREDHGVYVCQVNTHPPRMLVTNVTVLGNAEYFFLRYDTTRHNKGMIKKSTQVVGETCRNCVGLLKRTSSVT